MLADKQSQTSKFMVQVVTSLFTKTHCTKKTFKKLSGWKTCHVGTWNIIHCIIKGHCNSLEQVWFGFKVKIKLSMT